MSEYRLHCLGESGNCYKVALMLQVCGLPWTPVFVDYFGGETRGDAYRESRNELGEVPMLEAEFGRPVLLNILSTTWAALHAAGERMRHRPDASWGKVLASL